MPDTNISSGKRIRWAVPTLQLIIGDEIAEFHCDFCRILGDLPSFWADRTFFAGQNEAMAEVAVKICVGKPGLVAQSEHFGRCERLGDGNRRIVSDHGAGEEGE